MTDTDTSAEKKIVMKKLIVLVVECVNIYFYKSSSGQRSGVKVTSSELFKCVPNCDHENFLTFKNCVLRLHQKLYTNS